MKGRSILVLIVFISSFYGAGGCTGWVVGEGAGKADQAIGITGTRDNERYLVAVNFTDELADFVLPFPGAHSAVLTYDRDGNRTGVNVLFPFNENSLRDIDYAPDADQAYVVGAVDMCAANGAPRTFIQSVPLDGSNGVNFCGASFQDFRKLAVNPNRSGGFILARQGLTNLAWVLIGFQSDVGAVQTANVLQNTLAGDELTDLAMANSQVLTVAGHRRIPGNSTADFALFQYRTDANGILTPLPRKDFGMATEDEKFHHVGVDADGDVYLVGSFRGSFTRIAGTTIPGRSCPSTTGAPRNQFVVKMNSTLDRVLWSATIECSLTTIDALHVNGPTVGIAGSFRDSVIRIGNLTLTNRGGADAFTARISAVTGGVLTANSAGGSGDDFGRGVFVETQPTAPAPTYTVGEFRDQAQFPVGTMPNGGGLVFAPVDAIGDSDYFIWKY